MYRDEVDKLNNKLDAPLEDLANSIRGLICFNDVEYYYDNQAKYNARILHIRNCENLIINILNKYLGLKDTWYNRLKLKNRPVTFVEKPFDWVIVIPVDCNEFKVSVVDTVLRESKWIEKHVTRKPHYTHFSVDCFGGELY